mmetsp:Transcript_1854/g.5438  ORF Transcript_1854/g.5438 Transcript_1854/m.5438 type:complete len:232 (-) Transcript_1854:1344-2039(-)
MLARIIGHQNFSAFRGSKMLGSACVTATPMSLAMPGSTEGIEPEDAWIVLCYTQHYLAPPGRKDVTLETALDTSPGECPFPAWSAPPLACPWPRASCSIFLSSPISALRPFSSSRTPSTRSSSPLSSELFTDASRVHSLPSRFLFLFTSVLAFRKWMYCGYQLSCLSQPGRDDSNSSMSSALEHRNLVPSSSDARAAASLMMAMSRLSSTITISTRNTTRMMHPTSGFLLL